MGELLKTAELDAARLVSGIGQACHSVPSEGGGGHPNAGLCPRALTWLLVSQAQARFDGVLSLDPINRCK